MNRQESKIYQEALEKKKDLLRSEIDLSNQAQKEVRKRIESGTESITTLMAMQRTHSYTLNELALLLNQDQWKE